MILVAIVAELLEEYMALVALVAEHLLQGAPFPRRELRSLPFAAHAHALHVAARA